MEKVRQNFFCLKTIKNVSFAAGRLSFQEKRRFDNA